MIKTLHALLSPADYAAAAVAGFAGKVCVVFDVLRATSVMVTGLAHGVEGFLPVVQISEALAARRQFPNRLLAGERNGLRITAAQSGGVAFDLGNSPREYRDELVRGRIIITTTTNGTRAIRCCETASAVGVAAFLNLGATARWLVRQPQEEVLLVCAGTGSESALEDILAAGALCDRLLEEQPGIALSDAASVALRAFHAAKNDLLGTLRIGTNGSRLSQNSELRPDVEFCAQIDAFNIVGARGSDGLIRSVKSG